MLCIYWKCPVLSADIWKPYLSQVSQDWSRPFTHRTTRLLLECHKRDEAEVCLTNQCAGDMSCNRPDHLTTIRIRAGMFTCCGGIKERKSERTQKQTAQYSLSTSLESHVFMRDMQPWWFFLIITTLEEKQWGVKEKKDGDKCWRTEGEKGGKKERDYPTGRNERQKRKEVEWEDGRTGLF